METFVFLLLGVYFKPLILQASNTDRLAVRSLLKNVDAPQQKSWPGLPNPGPTRKSGRTPRRELNRGQQRESLPPRPPRQITADGLTYWIQFGEKVGNRALWRSEG
jgi:hypothetical protein